MIARYKICIQPKLLAKNNQRVTTSPENAIAFFATLALFARFIPTQQYPTAATNGKDIFYNTEFLQSLTTPQQDGLLLHEVLHAALLHVLRRGGRDRQLWNIADNIVVNGIICQQGCFELPEGGIIDRN